MAKKQELVEEVPQSIQTKQLNLTQLELIHIRDVFSLLLPADLTTTLSQALAQTQNRTMEEVRLWAKISEACVSMNVPMGDAAPDFIVAVTGNPSIGVFQLNSSLQQQEILLKQELQTLLD